MKLSDSLNWRAGDWVEVRGADEILATLDASGRLDAMPFMPEMLAHCGKRFRIVKAAHKTCDPTGATNLRRMEDAVHLETRCDGSRHGGCQAGCMFFWKTAWLKRVKGDAAPAPLPHAPAAGGPCTLAALDAFAVTAQETTGEPVYRCQATEIVRATKPLSPLAPLQFVQDILSRNVTFGELIRYMPLAALKSLRVMLRRCKAAPAAAQGAGAVKKPAVLAPRTLAAGERVRVRPRDEIEATLNRDKKLQGLSFDSDMRRYCGSEHEVLWRVEKLIDEKTGRMLHIARDCIVLKDVICTGLDCRNRLFCSRGVYTFWREAWLKKPA